jgi:tetratricopeptide (TPR) repeat protein
MITRISAVALTFAVGLSACSHDKPAPAHAAKAAKKAAPASVAAKKAAKQAVIDRFPAQKADDKGGPPLGPEGPSTARSTSGALFLRNLAAQEKVLRDDLATGKATAGEQGRLSQLEAQKFQYDGDLSHNDAALVLIEQALKQKGNDRGLLGQKASLHSNVHRFPEAIAIREALVENDPKDARAKVGLGFLLWTAGRYDEALPLLGTPIPAKTNDDYGLEAVVAFQKGDPDAADHLLRLAEGAYNDVNPVTMAWLDFQRGFLRLRTGRYEEAQKFLAAAHARLPEYTTVAEHLAECEELLGHHEEALRLYEEIVKRTGLPEFIDARAKVLKAMGDEKGAKAGLAEADKAWKARLAQHPTAWAAHAISFWLDDKPDLAEAAKWAKLNLTVRRDVMSLLQAARAFAKSDPKQARSLIEEAAKTPVRTDEVYREMAAAWLAVGEPAKAHEAFTEARKRNPRIEAPAGMARN